MDSQVNGKNGDEDINIDHWMVASTSGGRYLGRICGGLEVNVAEVTSVGHLKKHVTDLIGRGDLLELMPAFDFMAPMRPVQQEGRVAMVRDPIVVPPDFTLHEVPIYVKVGAFYLCMDMKEADKNTYKDFVRAGLALALRQRAAQSGITLASKILPEAARRG